MEYSDSVCNRVAYPTMHGSFTRIKCNKSPSLSKITGLKAFGDTFGKYPHSQAYNHPEMAIRCW